jgi:hypothetical protein
MYGKVVSVGTSAPDICTTGSVSGSGPVSTSTPPPCECWSETLRIVDLSQNCAQTSTSVREASTASKPTSLLQNTLTMGRNLVQHWGALNGCANAESHLGTQTLRYMADAIGWVLRDHEVAIDDLSRRPQPHRAAEGNPPRTFIGRLELDPAEAAVVVQEALKHSLIRLAAMLQDIEEETALMGRSEAADPLWERNIKNHITQLFRMLGSVNRLDTV